jgi:hypothetical protein
MPSQIRPEAVILGRQPAFVDAACTELSHRQAGQTPRQLPAGMSGGDHEPVAVARRAGAVAHDRSDHALVVIAVAGHQAQAALVLEQFRQGLRRLRGMVHQGQDLLHIGWAHLSDRHRHNLTIGTMAAAVEAGAVVMRRDGPAVMAAMPGRGRSAGHLPANAVRRFSAFCHITVRKSPSSGGWLQGL